MLGSSSQRIGVVRSYPRKSQIVHEGDPADRVYEVVSGTVCASKMLREGRRQIAGFYFAGDIFGLESVKQHSVAVQAITNAKVRIFKKRALTELGTSNLEVADRLLALTTRELARKQDHLLMLLCATSVAFIGDGIYATNASANSASCTGRPLIAHPPQSTEFDNPRNTQNLPYGLPGGCYRFSTVKEKAWRIAANIAKLPGLLRKPEDK